MQSARRTGTGRRVLTALAAAVLCLGGALPAPADDAKPDPHDGDAPLTEAEQKEHDKKVKEILDRLRKEKNKERVRAEIQNLGSGGRAARDALIEFSRGLKNQDFLTEAFRTLGKIGGKVVVEYLTGEDGLRSFTNFLVQIAATETLGEMKDARALDALLEILDHKRAKIEVQGAICQAISRIAPTDERVVKAVFDRSRHKKDTIRANAVEALGRLGTDEAFERLVLLLVEEKNTRVRGAAATGLGHTGRQDAVEHLRRSFQEDRAMTVRECCKEALGKLGATLVK